MGRLFKQLLWRCAGATVLVLEKPLCALDHNKQAGIGATVLLTSILAGLSGGYAFYRAFASYRIAIPLGMFWGILVFNLDRFMVMTIKKRETPSGNRRVWLRVKSTELLASSPRLLLAFFLALVIAKPLELKLFQPEVELEVVDIKREMEDADRNISAQAMAQQAVTTQGDIRPGDSIASLKQENAKLDEDTSNAHKEWQKLNELARKELYGERGDAGDDFTGDPGPGKFYRNRQEAADKAKAEYERRAAANKNQIEQNQKRIDRLIETQETLAKQASDKRIATDGLAIRLAALSSLTSKDARAPYSLFGVYQLQGAVYRYANWAIIALLELAPILSKIFIPYGPYDRALEAEEEKSKLLQEQELLNLRAGLETLKGSKDKRKEILMAIQDVLLDNLKDELRNVTDDSEITKAELNEMKRVLVREAISELNRGDGKGRL